MGAYTGPNSNTSFVILLWTTDIWGHFNRNFKMSKVIILFVQIWYKGVINTQHLRVTVKFNVRFLFDSNVHVFKNKQRHHSMVRWLIFQIDKNGDWYQSIANIDINLKCGCWCFASPGQNIDTDNCNPDSAYYSLVVGKGPMHKNRAYNYKTREGELPGSFKILRVGL